MLQLVIIFSLLTSCWCHRPVRTSVISNDSSTTRWIRPTKSVLVNAGDEFTIKCQIDTIQSGMRNVTITTLDDTIDTDYFQIESSKLQDRSTYQYFTGLSPGVVTAILTVHQASILDTGFYGCKHLGYPTNNDSTELPISPLDTREYVFVHPHVDVGDSTNHIDAASLDVEDSIPTEELLLPTLEVYVLYDDISNQVIPLKPTHPDVEFFLSKKGHKTNYYTEIFSTKYNATKQENWIWDKHHGLILKKVQRNITYGTYWGEAKIGKFVSSRHFRIFVTSSDASLPTYLGRPRIKKSVEFLVYPSGRSFKLTCEIRNGLNVTWRLPNPWPQSEERYSTRYYTNKSIVVSELSMLITNYMDTGNYTCVRTDDASQVASQYIFISDLEKLLLPTNSTYVFNRTQKIVVPCKPNHPDVEINLIKTTSTGRGVENITIYETANQKGDNGWGFSKFRGFHTKTNATLEIVGQKLENFFCQASKSSGVSETHSFGVFFAEATMKTIHEYGPVVEGDEITLECVTLLKPAVITWTPANSSIPQFIQKSSTKHLARIDQIKIGDFARKIELIWYNVSKAANGVYECHYQESTYFHAAVESYYMVVQAALAPRLVDEVYETREVVEGITVGLVCHLDVGAPFPKISWFKNNALIDRRNQSRELSLIHSLDGKSILEFKIESENVGEYKCRYENRVGFVEKKFLLQVISNGGDNTMIAVIVILIIIAFLLMMMARILYVRFSDRYKRARNALTIGRVLGPLLAGNPERINHRLPLDEQSELLPYDRTWEFPRNRLVLGQQLGAGCFGRVLKAQADGIVQESVIQTVAVKMVRSYADLSALASLVSELKILIHLGSHVNIVNLLGACTDVAHGDFLVIVEYCRFGNLLNYIIDNRHTYMNQVNDQGEFIHPSSSLSTSDDNSGYLYMGASTYSREAGSIIDPPCLRQAANQQSDYLVMLTDSAASYERRNSVSADEDAPLSNQLFSTYHLLCWAFQIARGMRYLSGRNVVHGDLAARNILLANNSVVKIADFGLARKVYQDSNYKKKGEGMLPVKWMAIESLTDRIFSTQSDVWAFGVTLWELFSLGKAPYSDIEDIKSLIHFLESGNRLEISRITPHSVVRVIENCWRPDPSSRFSFDELEQILGDLMENEVKNYFVEMDELYRRRNMEKFRNVIQHDESSNESVPSSSGYINVVSNDKCSSDDAKTLHYQNVVPI